VYSCVLYLKLSRRVVGRLTSSAVDLYPLDPNLFFRHYDSFFLCTNLNIFYKKKEKIYRHIIFLFFFYFMSDPSRIRIKMEVIHNTVD